MKKKEDKSKLYEFYGLECPHCMKMKPLIEKLEKEIGVKFQSLEVWHNPENAKLMEKFDQGLCGGVPFFYNEETDESICGETSYEKLKKFAIKMAIKGN
ncbi:MAG TPA: thioredoxin domain-containing protein [Candidatus Nanoarchaeia archaeon]|nr:thioredoxin domain-containing protein [Candidatus Nanoarchaeia archaeon]